MLLLKHKRGFTLLEVMIVTAIIGIAAAMSVVGIQKVVNYSRVNGNAATIAQILANTRVRAITTRCSHETRITFGAPSFVEVYKRPCAAVAVGPDPLTTVDPGDPAVQIPNDLRISRTALETGVSYFAQQPPAGPANLPNGSTLNVLFDGSGVVVDAALNGANVTMPLEIVVQGGSATALDGNSTRQLRMYANKDAETL